MRDTEADRSGYLTLHSTAVLTVKIKNHGSGAYKRDLYGDTIVVERHFTVQGASGFKLKNKDGRIISTKKMELDDITDFFALQLDNPVNVLTQDQARQFLNSSSDADKYRFFMKGVQLEQLDNDYSVLGQELDNTEEALITVQDDCKVLKEKYQIARKRLQLTEKTDSIRDKIKSCSRQAAWVQVEEQEHNLERCEQAIEDARQRVQQAENSFHNIEAQYDHADQVVDQAKREIQQLKHNKLPLEDSHREAKEKFEAVRTEISEANNTVREIKGNLDSERKRKTETEKALHDEYERLNSRSGGREAEKRNEIRETEEAYANIQGQGRDHDATYSGLEERRRNADDNFKAAGIQERQKHSALQEAKKQLQELQKDNRDPLAAFHPSMRTVLKAIDQDRGFTSRPIGPLAFHVRNKQPQWQSMIEKTFGNLLNNFIVMSRRDQERLSDILAKCKCHSNVLVAPTNFRIATLKEPDTRFNTILRALDIDDDVVRDQLVINSAIEQTILVESQDKAVQLTEHGLPDNCKAIMCPHPRERNRGFRYQQGRGGSQKMEPVEPWGRPYRMKTDNDAAKRSQQETVDALKDELYEAEQQKSERMHLVNSASQTLQQHKRQKKELQLQSQRSEDRLAQLKNELESMQPQDGALDGLKHQLEDHNEQIGHFDQQLEAAKQEKEDIALQNRENKHTLETLTSQLREREDAVEAADSEFKKYEATRMKLLKQKNEADHARNDRKSGITRAESERDGQAANVLEYTTEATKISNRVPIEAGMTFNALEKKMNKLNNEIARQDQELGASKEKIQWDHLEAKKKLTEAEENFAKTFALMQELMMTLKERTGVWKYFRQHITYRARYEFSRLMSARGFVGNMRIDHQRKSLSLDVNPDTRRGNGSGARQTKTLSGGEKSFSTVCMLLALWEAMGSPIRCLDEFDVFMDSINRDISMKMMIECARQAIGRQFILITPQAMGGVEYGNDVKIHRLRDPERGQQTLNIPGA